MKVELEKKKQNYVQRKTIIEKANCMKNAHYIQSVVGQTAVKSPPNKLLTSSPV